MEKMDWVYRVCRWVLGGLFIYAGSTKLMDPEIFAVLIDAYGILPEVFLMPTAVGLPLLEVIAGIGILLDIRGSLAILTGMLVLFITILGYGIWMGLDVDCGCFGPDDPEAEAFHGLRTALFRDTIMLGGVVFLYIWRWCRSIRPTRAIVLFNHLLFTRRKKDATV